LSCHLRPPGGKFFVEFLGELSHALTLSLFYRSRKAEFLLYDLRLNC
jgi:hypothetical protein